MEQPLSNEAIFDIWAPPTAIWSPWAKPVVFAHADRQNVVEDSADSQTVDIAWAGGLSNSTAIIVDMPGVRGVMAGIAVASIGYRPVPLYNAIPGMSISWSDPPVVDVQSVVCALIRCTPIVASLDLAVDAPPVFLLDAGRRIGRGPPTAGQFDNRSVSLPTDFPSGNFMLSQNVARVILVQESDLTAQPDLAHTLLRWQEAGVQIMAKSLNNLEPPRPIIVPRPSHFRALFYNMLATLGLRRSALGGFGGLLPMASGG
jgi:hypothetical protein